MSSLRCSMCGINYPVQGAFNNCPVHGIDTDLMQADPDPDWTARAERLMASLKRAEEGGDAIPRVEDVPLHTEHGRLWVSDWDLVRAGVRFAKNQSFRLFELDGMIYETQGWHESGRRWWVELVAPAVFLAH